MRLCFVCVSASRFAKLVTPQKRLRPVSQLSQAGRRYARGGKEEMGWEVKGHGGEEEAWQDSWKISVFITQCHVNGAHVRAGLSEERCCCKAWQLHDAVTSVNQWRPRCHVSTHLFNLLLNACKMRGDGSQTPLARKLTVRPGWGWSRCSGSTKCCAI